MAIRGPHQDPVRLPELRRGQSPLAGQVRGLRRVEHPHRGGRLAVSPAPAGQSTRRGRVIALDALAGSSDEAPRVETGIAEFDRVTGGGLVRGSALLVGGDPGIGKSTLLLQAAAALAGGGRHVVYRLRRGGGRPDPPARRAPVGIGRAGQAGRRDQRRGHPCDLVGRTDAAPADRRFDPDAVDRRRRSAPGTVTQVRASSQALIRYAKQTGAAVIFIGHVTKDGQIAGPRVVEHMVDGVLTSRATPATISASCGRSKTASARPTRSACSR